MTAAPSAASPTTRWAISPSACAKTQPRAQALAGFDPLAVLVATRADLDDIAAHLDHLGIPHGPVTTATLGWLLSTTNPNGVRPALLCRGLSGIRCNWADTPSVAWREGPAVTETIEPMAAQIDQQQLAEELVAQARAEGVQLVGPGGLLTGLTKTVLETALEVEISDHLGYDKHDPAGPQRRQLPQRHRTKTVLTEIGPVEIEVPRDRDGTFEPVIVRKRQRRLNGVDEIVLSLTAKGLTTGEIAAHFAEVYGAKVSKDTISRITDKVIEEMTEWRNRPLESVYPVVFIDAIVVKVRDGQVANRPVYVAIGVTVRRRTGHPRAVGRRRRRGRQVLAGGAHRDQEPRRRRRVHRGLRRAQGPAGGDHHDVAARDRADLRDASAAQHLPLRLPQGLGRDGQGPQAGLHRADAKLRPRPASTSSPRSGAPGTRRSSSCGRTPGASSCRSWTTTSRSDKIICTTNAIEIVNARYRRAVRARGHFPTEQAALKCLYLVTRSLDPTGRGGPDGQCAGSQR